MAEQNVQPICMFYEAFDEYKDEGVFIKLMEEIQNMECSYFKSECYSIPIDCEKINERRFRQMLKNSRILYSKVSDYDLAMTFIHEAFGNEKKYRYYKDEISNIKNHLYATSIDWILKNKIRVEITDESPYIDKIAVIEAVINYYNMKISKYEPDDMTDKDITIDDLLNPAFKSQILPIINEVENKANSPLTNNETIAICYYKLFEINNQGESMFDFDKFKSKQNSFNDFKEIINLLSFDAYCDWVKKFMKSEDIKEEEIYNIFLSLPTDEIWDCVIADAMINSYIDICMWNNNEMFKCSFEDLFHKFDEEYIHYTSTANDKDVPLVKKFIDDEIDTSSKVKSVIRIRNTFKEIDPSGYVSNFFNRIPRNIKNTKSTEIPEFSMAMIFSLLMYKYSFGRKKSTASEVDFYKLCKCINCYMKLVSRNTFAQEIDKTDLYKARCFLEKYLLNLIYNVNGIIRYSTCNFNSDELRKSYRNKLVCNKYILTYQKLCSLQSNSNVNIIHFMTKDIMDECVNILTYMLTSIKASSIEAYQNVINSFKLYLINDTQSPKYLIEDIIPIKNETSDLSADDYAHIFGFNYYKHSKKSHKKYLKDHPTQTSKSKQTDTHESNNNSCLAAELLDTMNRKNFK